MMAKMEGKGFEKGWAGFQVPCLLSHDCHVYVCETNHGGLILLTAVLYQLVCIVYTKH